ncbi:MAG TPA: tRNA (adenosine(37)-N6)-threonylcarbamoyltransferase complex ATPase subunit type 1 TsaE [Rubrobacteraceae bacterium]|nr:tRNA (adenosine(37)-N6)-threonylcarbamoyltransferase complex ATPase subunit type 1 TsaE [Rubrobacteraceae bacterium]
MEYRGLDEAAFKVLAASFAARLAPGDVIVLVGEVGSGKTTFVREAARALGVSARVTSPTYQLARGYEGVADGRSVAVNHLDLYRLEGIEHRDVLELDDYLDPDAVTFIEWADPALDLLRDPTIVRIYHETPATRRVEMGGPAADRLAGYA